MSCRRSRGISRYFPSLQFPVFALSTFSSVSAFRNSLGKQRALIRLLPRQQSNDATAFQFERFSFHSLSSSFALHYPRGYAVHVAHPIRSIQYFLQTPHISTSQRLNKRLISSHETHPNVFTANGTPVSQSSLCAGSQKLCRRRCHRCCAAIVSIGHTFNSADDRLSHRPRDQHRRERTDRRRRSDAGG